MKFGLYTAGVDGAGGTATFDYFKVNGSTGCGGGTNTAPVITSATATPTAGFAPLAVNVGRRGDRRQRGCAHVRVGLRRQRLHRRHGRHGVDHVHHRRATAR